MSWDLDGVDQYLNCAMPSGLQTAPGGPMTHAFLVNLDAVTDGGVMCNMSGTTVYQFTEVFTGFNYGTSAGTRNGPAASGYIGSWAMVIISKNTGNIAPEYSILQDSGSGFAVVASGNITGGGATLGDGVAPGASGFIRIGRWGTSGTEYINGRLAAVAQYTTYKDATARALLTTWNAWLATGSTGAGLQFAMEFTALTTRVDASGNSAGETGRFGTASITLGSDPANFFPSSGTTAPDTSPPAAMRWTSTTETAVANGIAADTSTPGALRWRSSLTESGLVGVTATDTAFLGWRWRRSSTESGLVNVVGTDTAPLGWRWQRSATEAGLAGVIAADTASTGYWFRESPATGDVATVAADTIISGWSWSSRTVDGAAVGVVAADTQALGWRLRESQTGVAVSVVGTDTPNGLRWRTGATGYVINPPDGGGDVIGYDTVILGLRWGQSPAAGYAGSPVTEEPDFYVVVAIDRFSSEVGIDRFSSVTVADRL